MTHNTCSSDLCEFVSVVGARQVDVSMLKRLLSPRSESLEPMAASCLETTFDAVVDAQSQHYAVPALALASVTKQIQKLETAKALHMAEVERSTKLTIRSGQKQKASALMEATPLKKPYKPNA